MCCVCKIIVRSGIIWKTRPKHIKKVKACFSLPIIYKLLLLLVSQYKNVVSDDAVPNIQQRRRPCPHTIYWEADSKKQLQA